jgi:phenylpropionate dioxygenase-like ring-hydroxylating dioxygenase large terminal subunit
MGDDKDMSAAEFTNAHPALAEFWHPVALSCDLGEEPVPVRLAGQGWALARIGGDLVAFADACPARATLHRAAEVTEHDGLVWLAPLPPRGALPELAPGGALEGEGVATVRLPVLRVEANAAMLIDNFLDEAHLPFVHAATIGGAGPETIPRADVARRGLSFTAVREHTFTNLTDPAVRDGSRPAVQRRRMTYRYQAPLAATLLLEFLDAGGWQFLTFVVTPEDERTCAVYQTVTGPGLADPEQADSAAKYEMTIFEEDLDLQRRALSGLEFPLDPAAELHTRADRVSVEFRRVLASAVGAHTAQP